MCTSTAKLYHDRALPFAEGGSSLQNLDDGEVLQSLGCLGFLLWADVWVLTGQQRKDHQRHQLLLSLVAASAARAGEAGAGAEEEAHSQSRLETTDDMSNADLFSASPHVAVLGRGLGCDSCWDLCVSKINKHQVSTDFAIKRDTLLLRSSPRAIATSFGVYTKTKRGAQVRGTG